VDMDISMDIHGKSVDMDMDGKFHIHGKPVKALQLQFFMAQAVNYSVIIVKIKCKNPQYHK